MLASGSWRYPCFGWFGGVVGQTGIVRAKTLPWANTGVHRCHNSQPLARKCAKVSTTLAIHITVEDLIPNTAFLQKAHSSFVLQSKVTRDCHRTMNHVRFNNHNPTIGVFANPIRTEPPPTWWPERPPSCCCP